ncbi:hypothetical protein H6F44_11865 [Pseudanabaena sp. FACHB-1277]|uniref:Virion structural protein n=1 Tax=Pseudanabaena cinerea FACHB-1277 TaxID=2949581 RepID=A0A926UU09_9CYAN|nr:hypothetical protein [Pseudanabaena cinerea]MBD2150811.1 hypothetical protein [Pseudanabaena cinerea FACHB-1277]
MSLIYAPINELPFAPNFEGNDYLLIWDISQPANQARRLTFTALASFLAYTSREFEWADIINKPDTFPPASHTHIPADILGFDSAVDARLGNLPNGAIIGGAAHFTDEVPPATRRDGSLIQIGDRLLKNNGQRYFYDGSDWVTEQAGGIAGRWTFVGASEPFLLENATLIGYQDLSALKIVSLNIRYFLLTQGGLEDANNYWRFAFVFRGSRNQNQSGFFNWEMSLRLDGIAFPLPTLTPQHLILYPPNPKTAFCDLAAISAAALKFGSVTSILQASFVLVTRGVHP